MNIIVSLLLEVGIASLTFCIFFAAALAGMAMQRKLPATHLAEPTQKAVQLVMGLIATMAALVLSLLVASAHTYLETQQENVQILTRDVLLLDQTLGRYGPEAAPIRRALYADVVAAVNTTSPNEGVGSVIAAVNGVAGRGKHLSEDVLDLDAKTTAQKFFQTRALELAAQIASTRLTMHEQSLGSVPVFLMIILVAWLTMLFLGFGLYAPRNKTVVLAFGCGAFAVAGALFLILDMNHPYRGLIHVSDAPIRDGLTILGK